MEENIERKSWWKRNWGWALPTGGCLIILILIIAFGGALFYGITSAMKDSDAYSHAMEKVQNDEVVLDRLGEPIESNGAIGGSFSSSNGYKTAEITIPIKGPNGEATVRVEGNGVGDSWNYTLLDVYVHDSDEIINLLEQEQKVLDQ